jgi:polyisoprenoid-binding protein YceI
MIYNIDPQHTIVQFKVRHMMIANIRGAFGKTTGTVNFDEANPANSTVEVSIDTATLMTTDPNRDAHLKGPDFFDVEKYPVMTFHSKSVSPANGRYNVTGSLSIHGETKEVTASVSAPTNEVKDPWGNLRRGIEATLSISRKDFGLTWNAAIEGGGVIVSDNVDILIDAELVRQP